MDKDERSEDELQWRVDEEATAADIHVPAERIRPLNPGEEGRTVFRDEDGQRRRLPVDLTSLSPAHRDAALAAMQSALGAGPPNFAVMAAVQRLDQMRASGRLSEEQYQKERKRIEEMQ
ncbi:MAG: hypothetical protein H0W96_15960 [Solirubrobacterales bacterium]|nr:hypothetical protein [Solirubrobacterales bacterium]